MYHEPEFEPTREEMMAILERHVPFLNRMELIPLDEADGRIAAEDVAAPYALPNRAVSSCDGIAVRFADVADAARQGEDPDASQWREDLDASQRREDSDASQRREVPDASQWKEGREYVYSNTGVAIPDGFDTVIPIEEVERKADGTIRISTFPRRRGEEVDPAGTQMAQGETLVCRGERLGPVSLSILLSAGFQSVAVYAKPRVVFLPTGDELVPSGGRVPEGKNVESNSLLVAGLLRRFGCQPSVSGILPDDPEVLEAALLGAVKRADMVIIGAGSSKGDKDFTMDVLDKIGKVVVWELGVAPGKHCSLTLVDGVPVMGIPGPPGGAQLICQYYVRAAAELLMTGRRQETFRVSARLTEDVPGKWMDFMQSVRLFWDGGEFRAEPLAFDGTRASRRQAFAQVLYCPKGKDFHEGERVVVELPFFEMKD